MTSMECVSVERGCRSVEIALRSSLIQRSVLASCVVRLGDGLSESGEGRKERRKEEVREEIEIFILGECDST